MLVNTVCQLLAIEIRYRILALLSIRHLSQKLRRVQDSLPTPPPQGFFCRNFGFAFLL